jgi:hypothetical protein
MPTDGRAVPRINLHADPKSEFKFFIRGTALPSVGTFFLIQIDSLRGAQRNRRLALRKRYDERTIHRFRRFPQMLSMPAYF